MRYFFLPSITEGIANVVLEAMSMELPVVSTNAGGLGEVIRNGENGISCAVYDHVAMADALELVCRDKELRRALWGRRGKRSSWGITCKSILMFMKRYMANWLTAIDLPANSALMGLSTMKKTDLDF